MDFLGYISHASRYKDSGPGSFADNVKVNIVTNFTDDILKNVFTGVNLANNIYPVIYKTPYRQYHIELKNPQSGLYANEPDITFIFFDANPFKESEFHASRQHFEEISGDIERYARAAKGTVVLNNFIVSYQGAHGNLFKSSPFFNLIREYNEKFEKLAEKLPNLVVFDTNRLVHILGESRVFDTRGLYAFDIPFSNEFTAILAEEWFAYARALKGKSKKCIVLDLDNTLWGGVAGEAGPLGIALGPDYPGNAFVSFQRALLDFYNRGVILAIASKNNLEDVAEVFRKNPNMVLKENHFSAIRANWDEKADNLEAIAKELNIGLESMVFFDDDRLNREIVKARLPEVAVPDFSLPPEDYVKMLYSLNLFHQFSLTREDAQRGKMYAEERQRKKVSEKTKDVSQYIAELGIEIEAGVNSEDLVPRLSQLTLKTNQFNLTTKRYSESEVKKFISGGARVFSADVSDKFGGYGVTLLAIVVPVDGAKSEAELDTFLMSCRVMGRGVECVFMDYLVRDLAEAGFRKLHAVFSPTAKNKPAENFLEEHGFRKVRGGGAEDKKEYVLDVAAYVKNPCAKINKAIKINRPPA